MSRRPRIDPAHRSPHATLMALALAAPLLLAGCGGDDAAPPRSFPPLTYGYLQPLRLNVASIEINDQWASPPGAPDLSARSPAVPVQVLAGMARDRLQAIGTSGRAVFTVEDASITPRGDTLDGHLQVRLDVYTSNGQRAAYADATAVGSSTGPDDESGMPGALYDLTRRMMTDMNVEFQYQLAHGVGDWLQAGTGPAPPPIAVQQQALPPPGSTQSPGSIQSGNHSPGPPGLAPTGLAPPGVAPPGQPLGFRFVPPPPPGS